MIHIAICDDEKPFVDHFLALLARYSEERGEAIKTTTYDDGLALIEHYDPTIDLLFLDIRMRLIDGLQAAAHVRRQDAQVGLIFLTTYTEFALDGYTYQATNYIVKPLGYARLKAELDRFIARRRAEEASVLVIANDEGRFKVPLRAIHYIETFKRNLLLHAEQEDIICYCSMKEMEAQLAGNDFVRCHTSYLVNLFYVKDVKKLELELVSGEHIPISQPKRKAVMARLVEYWGDAL